MLSKQGQQVRELLAAGMAAGYAGHAQFKEVQKAVLGEVQAQVEGTESWLKKVRGDLMAANSVQRTRAVDTQPAGVSSLLQISVGRSPSSQNAVARSAVQPTLEWLANTFRALGVGHVRRLGLPGNQSQQMH